VSAARLALLITSGLLLLACSVSVAVTIGPADITPGQVWRSAAARFGWGESPLSELREGIVWNLRMPRTLLAAVCGAGLALCGAVMQSLLRNPLADPFVLGVSSGASTGAVAVIVLGWGAGVLSLSAGAFVGALLSFGMVMLLSHSLGGSMDRVVLSGVAAMQLFSALTSFIVLTSADAETTRGVLFWLLGALSGAGWSDVLLCTAVLCLVLAVCLANTTTLDAFAFGEEAAASLGVRVGRARVLLLSATALLTAALVGAVVQLGDAEGLRDAAYLLSSLRRIIFEQKKQNHARARRNRNYLEQIQNTSFTIEELLIREEVAREKRMLLQSVLDQLSAREKEAIFLLFYHGLTNEEISQVMDLSNQCVRNLMYNSLRRLRSCVEQFSHQ
jgi:iron complex transport system permease protein